MSRIKSVDTGPELIVRKLAHKLGFRFRLHAKHLPGRPDLVFRRHHAVIFVHGCFWHQHDDGICRRGTLPKSNNDFWTKKLRRNVERDNSSVEALEGMGWRSLIVWECETAHLDALETKITKFLDEDQHVSA